MSDELRRESDLSDPIQLTAQLDSLAGGMDQQAIASRSGTALGGHPYPEFFYGQVAVALRAAALMIRHLSKEPITPAPPVAPPEPPRRK